MKNKAKTLEEAAAEILAEQKQAALEKQQREAEKKVSQKQAIRAAFEETYPDLLPLLQASGIVYTVEDAAETEDYWADMVFYKGQGEDLRIYKAGVNNYAKFEFMCKSYSYEELILLLAENLK